MASTLLTAPSRWFVQLSPASKVVLVSTTLNVALVLLFTLGVAPLGVRSPYTDLPLLHPWAVLIRTSLAVLVVLAVLRAVDLVRPTWRSLGLGATILTVATALLTVYYTPVLALAYLPIVFRVRLSLLRAVAASVLSMSALLLLSWQLHGQSVLRLGWSSRLDAVTLALAAGALGAYLLLSFELALREARARQEILTSHRELRRLRDLELRGASLDERARVARELHDTLGHHLTAQRFDLAFLREDLDVGTPLTPAHAEVLARVAARGDEALHDLRAAVQALRTAADAPGGAAGDMTAALARLVQVWSPDTRVELDVRDVGPLLNDDGRLTVYRAAQEALTNARKHAPGQPLTLSLHATNGPTGDVVRFEARNPGDGPVRPGGFGVSGLRERARLLGGDAGLLCENGTLCLWMTLPVPSRS